MTGNDYLIKKVLSLVVSVLYRQPYDIAGLYLTNKVLHELGADNPELDTLSIGTTQDMEAAIAEGATCVRIGTAVFGPRDR